MLFAALGEGGGIRDKESVVVIRVRLSLMDIILLLKLMNCSVEIKQQSEVPESLAGCFLCHLLDLFHFRCFHSS